MLIEEKLPDSFRRNSFHPSLFVYAWKKQDLEKLFEEFMQSNIAIMSVEAWLVEGEKTVSVIPLQSGKIDVFYLKNQPKEDEDWFDFVERSAKETLGIINSWNLEKRAMLDKMDSIYYHFSFAEE